MIRFVMKNYLNFLILEAIFYTVNRIFTYD